MILGTSYVQNTDVTSIAAKIKEGSSTFGLGGHPLYSHHHIQGHAFLKKGQ